MPDAQLRHAIEDYFKQYGSNLVIRMRAGSLRENICDNHGPLHGHTVKRNVLSNTLPIRSAMVEGLRTTTTNENTKTLMVRLANVDNETPHFKPWA